MWKIKIEKQNAAATRLQEENSFLEKKVFQFQSILDSMVEGVITLDSQGEVIFLNPAAEKIFSITKDGCLHKPLLEAIRNHELLAVYSKALQAHATVSCEINMLLPIRRVFHVNAVVVKQEGLAWAVVMILNDITELRKLEAVRRDFVANVSHELKTPLTSIKGFVETLLEGAIDDKENNRKFLAIIHEHSERLESLILDLLQLSRIESSEVMLNLQEVGLAELVKEIAEGFRVRLKENKITCEIQIAPACIIKADEERIRQVLNNLIDNAIKFNRENGSIKIYAKDFPSGVRVIVEDTGDGIPEKDVARIFERFYRVDKARSRSLGGTGLGLSIVKHIIELHKGEVGVESIEGQGSKFYFSLPKQVLH